MALLAAISLVHLNEFLDEFFDEISVALGYCSVPKGRQVWLRDFAWLHTATIA